MGVDLRKFIASNILEFLSEQTTKNSNVVNFLERKGISQSDFSLRNHLLKLPLKIEHKDKYETIIHTLENVYGWYLSGYQEDFYKPIDGDVSTIKKHLKYNLEQIAKEHDPEDYDDVEFGMLHFEPFISEQINVNDIPDAVYHVTDLKHLDRIKKIGLIPKSKSKATYHPERIYLFLERKNIALFLSHPDVGIEDPCLLTIDVSEFKNNNPFYVDPNLNDGGAYVLNNIPPKLILDAQTTEYRVGGFG